MRKIAGDLTYRIQQRTLSGRDEDNRAFAPYAADGPKSGQRVTLEDTGAMLGEMGPTHVTATSTRVGWTDADLEEIAGYHQRGTKKMPRRSFIGVPLAWVREAVRKHYKGWKG